MFSVTPILPGLHRPSIEPSPVARWIGFLVLCVLLFLKVEYAFHMPIDSDEPQHLHTVWGWTNGLLPYRDLFDNHMPLFQFLCAPLFRALGERPDVVAWMRLAMIPLFFGMLWCVYRIGAALHSKEAGLWAMIFTGFCHGFFFVSTEFRTDDLWSLLWLAAMVVLVEGSLTLRRSAIFGLLIGLDFCVSMKTSLLLGTFALAVAVVMMECRCRGSKFPWRQFAIFSGVALVCALLFPAMIGAFFWYQGAWKSFVYCVFQHNVVPGVIETGGIPKEWRAYYFPAIAPLLCAAAWRILQPGTAASRRLAVLLLSAGTYLAALWSYWPILSAEDYEPFYPLCMAVLTVAAFQFFDNARSLPRPSLCRAIVCVAILACARAWEVPLHHFWRDDTVEDVRMVNDVITLVPKGTPVMDGKCESIFRPRPYYFVLETMTDARFMRGLLQDDIKERLIETATPVARIVRLPSAAHHFVADNYLPITSRLFALGKYLPREEASPSAAAGATCRFLLSVRGRYAIVNRNRLASGLLDGEPLLGSRTLEPGPHVWQTDHWEMDIAVVWADAVEHGYYPVANRGVRRDSADPAHSGPRGEEPSKPKHFRNHQRPASNT